MRTLFALTLLVAGCAAEPPPESPTLTDEGSDTEPLDVPALLQILDSQADRITALGARLDAAESVAAAQTFDLDNAELWLQSLTADLVALQADGAEQDTVAATMADRLDQLQTSADAHAQLADVAFTSHAARLGNLEVAAAIQAQSSTDIKGQVAGLQSDLDAVATALGEAVGDLDQATADALVAVDDELDALDDRLDTLDDRVVGFEEVALDSTQTCTVGPVGEPVEYVLAAALDADQMLFQVSDYNGMQLIEPPATACGSTTAPEYPGLAPAVVDNGQVYVLDPAEGGPNREEFAWRTITLQ